MTGADRFEVGLTAALALIIALAIYDYILVPLLDDWMDRFTAWRDRHGSTEVEDAADLTGDEPCGDDGCECAGHEHVDNGYGACERIECVSVLRDGQWVKPWMPPPRDHYIDGDGEMHPIEEEVTKA